MIIEEARAKGIFRTKIMLAKAWESDPDKVDPADGPLIAMYKDEWIIMREPTKAESMRMNDKDPTGVDDVAQACIEDHTFTHQSSEGKVSSKEVWDLIKTSLTLYRYVVETWVKSTPLVRRSNGESAKLLSSTAGAGASLPVT
ncbi:hypothetical protein M0R72_13470 [Candidatus Pacearchaeota archaeon]|jgi:hypothetical protein|nr:hypothetical protein [Candidatus Pacearchaeota archaeon]